MNKINNIIREVPAEHEDFGYYFDNAGLTEAGGDYCYNLFIVPQSRNIISFNEGNYNAIQEEIEYLLQEYEDIVQGYGDARYTSVEDLLLWQGLIESVHDDKKIAEYISFIKACNRVLGPWRSTSILWEESPELVTAEYLSLKTGKRWRVDDAYGYSQGDYVKVIYCLEHYPDGGRSYGEIWLGAGKEFEVITLDESGEEVDTCGGYIIADCQVKKDKDYKKLVCDWAGIPIEETKLEMIDGRRTYTHYSYREV